MVTAKDIRAALSSLGLSGRPLCTHASLRSFGRVEGGAPALVEAVLAEGCTVMVPSFTELAVPPPAGWWRERNGSTKERAFGATDGLGKAYTPAWTDVAPDMGALAATVAAMPGRARGNHPLCSFTAIGMLAQKLVADQAPLDVCAPLRALAESGGFVMLMGVDLNRMTLLHLAEQHAGRALFRRWANGPDGAPIEVEVGGCSEGFEALAPALSAIEKRVQVGDSLWRVFPAGEALTAAASAIGKNPQVTHCGNPSCERCHDVLLGGPSLG